MSGARPDLLDLRTLTDRWRVRRDEEGLPVILGRRGSVSAHDLLTLCVYVRAGRRVLLALLRDLPAGWRRYQIGDEEANLLAPVADLDLACRIVRARRSDSLAQIAQRRAASPFYRRKVLEEAALVAQNSTIPPGAV